MAIFVFEKPKSPENGILIYGYYLTNPMLGLYTE